MKTQLDISKLLEIGKIQNELDFERALIADRKLRILSKEDSKYMINAVNAFKTDILFVGMTAPKQEKWVEVNKKELSVTVISSIGAVFDFYAGTVKRSGSFWINLGLEWFPRLIKEPKRLWRRNFISTPLFLLSLGKAKLGI